MKMTKLLMNPSLDYFLSLAKNQPTFMYNYSHFLADNVHEQFMNLTTQGVFRYSSIIIHLILFQQGDLFPIQLNRQDEQGVYQSVIH